MEINCFSTGDLSVIDKHGKLVALTRSDDSSSSDDGRRKANKNPEATIAKLLVSGELEAPFVDLTAFGGVGTCVVRAVGGPGFALGAITWDDADRVLVGAASELYFEPDFKK